MRNRGSKGSKKPWGTEPECADAEPVGLEEVIVGLAEVKIAKDPTCIAFIGLGSCIGLCAMDPTTGIAGGVHIMLPQSSRIVRTNQLGKFADTGVCELVRLMEEAGAERSSIQAAYAGGARLSGLDGALGTFDIGLRNVEAIRLVLESLKIPVKAKDAGGSDGRTLRMTTSTGRVTVRTTKYGEAVLCSLRG